MFAPSEDTYREVQVAPAGIWFVHSRGADTHAILLKSLSNILKAVIKGATVRICLYVQNTSDGEVLLSALYIGDDAETPTVIVGPHVRHNQHVALFEILQDRL